MLKFYIFQKQIYISVQTAEDIVDRNVQFLRLFHRKCRELKFSWILLLSFLFSKFFAYDKSLGFS